jgi:hypothetical protein
MAAMIDREGWNRRYAGDDLVWTAEPNRFLVAETEALTGRTSDRPRVRRGTQRDLAVRARLGGDRG